MTAESIRRLSIATLRWRTAWTFVLTSYRCNIVLGTIAGLTMRGIWQVTDRALMPPLQ